ncbi:VTC domain protein [Anaerohalosphaera lusitana]|uniref:VTC domain protein n=1 Tax=Anaerohalosphaera lusitana TaxID=1936003 RepID=A0A1U9NJX1_9BACT|nr:polyphosphate polymerase domain-containing protein [Anaerohalosphaera lusitana]AQT67880.1 VTC domain protein [Anaerohalosphaera lusitana]
MAEIDRKAGLGDNESVMHTGIRRKDRVSTEQIARSVPVIRQTESPRSAAEHPRSHKPNESRDRTLSCRYELKYRISESQAAAIREYIRPYLPLDKYSKDKPRNEYSISSLYFDSEQLSLYRETRTGKKNRFKLRIRAYADGEYEPRFAEIKRRINGVIIKSRAKILPDQVPDVIAGKRIVLPHEIDDESLKQFQLYFKSINARPVTLVRYKRQAFEGDDDNRVRITFDRNLQFKSTKQPIVTVNGGGWQSVSMDFVVLELKFTARYPMWLTHLVKSFALPQSAMSKYGASVEQACEDGFCAPQVGVF